MLAILSPAKSLNEETPDLKKTTEPEFLDEADYLAGKLKKFSAKKIGDLMNVNSNIASLNHERYQNWEVPFPKDQSHPAIYLFKGDCYRGLDAESWGEKDIEYAQDHLRILSGLYGLIRPMDTILPYRLEMGTRWKVTSAKTNLYKYWGDDLAESLSAAIDAQKDNVLLNLASNEYFKAVKSPKLDARIIEFDFKDFKNGKYKAIMTYAKQCRGAMAKFMIKNRLTDPEELKAFDEDGYVFNPRMSSEDHFVFTRG